MRAVTRASIGMWSAVLRVRAADAARRCLRVARVASLLLACAAAGPAGAEMMRSCDDPRVFAQTPVNVLLLPYTYTGTQSEMARPLSEAAGRLGLLMQHDSLIEMTKFETIGVVNLVNTPGARPCDADRIWDRMVGPQRDRYAGLRPGGAAVMIWGRIYEEGTTLYVQSYLRYGRADVSEQVERSVAAGYAQARFAAGMPAQVVALPPRRITRDDIAAINTEYMRRAVVRESASDSATIVDRLPDLGTPGAAMRPFGYGVTEVKGDWVRVVPLFGGQPGWIRARGDTATWPLRDRLPELYFLDAVVAYAHLRVAREASEFPKPAPADRLIDYSRQSLTRYRESVRDASPPADALGHALLGTMLLLTDTDGARLDGAQGEFGQAVRLVPYNAEARNLANVAGVLRCCAGRVRNDAAAAATMASLLDAVGVDPANRNALANLAAYHQLLDSWPEGAAAIGRAEIERQRAALKQVSVAR